MMNEQAKRLFFGLEVDAPWPREVPKGRVLLEGVRHLTLCFLGNVDFGPLQPQLGQAPEVGFRVGRVGYFNEPLFLPPHHPRVVSWHVDWLEDGVINDYQQRLAEWLRGLGYEIDRRPFLPHVTLARRPFEVGEWRRSFEKLPMVVKGIHLYESMGKLNYSPLWSAPMVPPFEEEEHTADLAFRVWGESLEQLQLHAQVALAFKFSPLLQYFPEERTPQSLDDVIIALNAIICRADSELGCPFKAVSFSGELLEREASLLEWLMIVDV